MGLFSRTSKQKMDRALDRLDSAAHYYEEWVLPFGSMHSSREMDRTLDSILDLFEDALKIARKYPELEVDPADTISYAMEKRLSRRAEETGRAELLPRPE